MSYVKGKTKNEILEEMKGTAHAHSVVQEQQKMGIIVRCTEDMEASIKSLEASMNNNAKSSDNLARKVYWLNIILTVATVIGTVIAGLALYKMWLS